MELVKLDSNVPIKAIPQVEEILATQFKFFIANLLSIKPENEEKVDNALPAIRNELGSMGFAEIKKMWELYADNKLDIEPKSNHFDRILVGHVLASYKRYKRAKNVPSKFDKQAQDIKDVIKAFDAFVQHNAIPKEDTWMYDFLDGKDLIKANPRQKKALMLQGKEEGLTEEESKDKSKRTILKYYFTRLFAKDQHIKDFL